MAQASKSGGGALDAAARPPERLDGTDIAAIALSLLWLLVSGGYFLSRPASAEGAGFVVVLMAVFLPVAMFWVAATAARASRVVRTESRRLQAAIDALRQGYIEDRQSRGAGGLDASVERKLDEIARAAKKTESAVAIFTSARGPAAAPAPARGQRVRPAPAEEQPALALAGADEPERAALPNADFIRAVNFPDSETDKAGFAALRRALRDRQARQLIQASQDMLTLLSQDGIYMDDLRPDLARPEVWRRFAGGERGRPIAALGGVRDRASLALAAGRMREDTIFRDTAHHFLRRFDQALARLEPEASDEEIVALSDTRTGRAFMLLGRVAGTFD